MREPAGDGEDVELWVRVRVPVSVAVAVGVGVAARFDRPLNSLFLGGGGRQHGPSKKAMQKAENYKLGHKKVKMIK